MSPLNRFNPGKRILRKTIRPDSPEFALGCSIHTGQLHDPESTLNRIMKPILRTALLGLKFEGWTSREIKLITTNHQSYPSVLVCQYDKFDYWRFDDTDTHVDRLSPVYHNGRYRKATYENNRKLE